MHREGDQNVEEVIAVSAHGPYVLLQVARSAEGTEPAAAPVARVLDQQIPLIDTFTPTDPAGFAALSLDPTGLLARTLALKPGQTTTMSNARYDRAGALQLEDDPISAQRALDAAGVDVVSVSQTTVYQAADPGGAQQLAQTLGDQVAAEPGSQPAAAVAGLAHSRCVSVDNTGGLVPKYWCIATTDRYAFKTVARQEGNAAQQLAAQYRLPTG